MAGVNPTNAQSNGSLGTSPSSAKGMTIKPEFGHDARDGGVGAKPTIAAVRRTPPTKNGRGSHDPKMLGC